LCEVEIEQKSGASLVFEFPAHGLDLVVTAAPVAWGKGRWPSVDWIDGEFIRVQRTGDRGALSLVRVWQPAPSSLLVAGFDDERMAAEFLRRTLGWGSTPPQVGDPIIQRLLNEAPGLRPFAHGSLEQGLMTVIIGQGVTVQAGAVLEGRVAAIHSSGIEFKGRVLRPFPTAAQIAETPVQRLRDTGLTWKRAEGMVAVARAALDGRVPSDEDARMNEAEAITRMRLLPMIGPWSANAALLWGLGADDAHVSGDVALLRAAKLVYDEPGLDLKSLDRLAEAWRPARAWAARVLWLKLLGPAPTNGAMTTFWASSDK